MRLLGFRYLRKRGVLTLAVILILASALFTMTSLTLLGFHGSFTSYLGQKENVLTVHDRSSQTPFTGLIPANLAERASSIEGVSVVSPEAIAPASVKDESVFIRGVVPEEFEKLCRIEVVEGSNLEYKDVNSALLGERFARRVDLHPGDWFVASGAMAERYALLEVEGVYRSGSALGDEILVPLYQGQWLRGTDQNHATLVRVGYDSGVVSREELRQELVGETEGEGEENYEEPPWEIVPISEIAAGSEEIGAADAEEFMGSYLGEFGVTRGALLALSIAVFLFAGAGAVVACRNLVSQHERELSILRSLGASRRSLKVDLLLKLLPWFILSSLTGLGLGWGVTFALQRGGHLRILTHTVQLSLSLTVALVLLLVTIGMAAISVLRASEEVDRL